MGSGDAALVEADAGDARIVVLAHVRDGFFAARTVRDVERAVQ